MIARRGRLATVVVPSGMQTGEQDGALDLGARDSGV